MESHIFDITILCSVVDNFGDIGVCWRLAKHLNEIRLKDSDFPKKFTLRFVCDNLVSFSKINSKINPEKSFQECDGIQIYSWNDYDLCYKTFSENEPEIILECFQCGQPDWMEKILFEDRVEHIVNIFMIDYLCAEKWVDDFHCLKSLTRTALVQKVNFMPGFTNKTGGLLLPERSRNKFGMTDGMFDLTDSHAELVSASVLRKRDRPTRMLFFAYERDWTCVVRAIKKAFSKKEKISNNQRDDIIIKIAGGAGQQSILEAFEKIKQAENASSKIKSPEDANTKNEKNLTVEKLDFMNQEEWDGMMSEMDFMIVRGEDSMAQSCLIGTPFIWQAYPQKDNYQMVKVEALLERMKNHFGDEFKYVENAWISLNDYSNVEDDTGNSVSWKTDDSKIENDVCDFILHNEELKNGFQSFARSLYENGDLAENLMTFILKSIKID